MGKNNQQSNRHESVLQQNFMSGENKRGTCYDDQRRDRTVKERKKCRNSGALLCKTGSSGNCRLYRRFFLPEQGSNEAPRKDNRIIMNGIVWLARSGAPWRDLPERYSSWNNGIQINKAYSGDYLAFKKKCLEKFMKYENG